MHRPVCFQHQMKQAPQKQKHARPGMPSRIDNFGLVLSRGTYTHEYWPVKKRARLLRRGEDRS
jgi:hypothetical protein